MSQKNINKIDGVLYINNEPIKCKKGHSIGKYTKEENLYIYDETANKWEYINNISEDEDEYYCNDCDEYFEHGLMK